MKQLFERLQPLFAVSNFKQQRGDLAFLRIPKDHAEMLVRHLRDHEGFSHLVFFTAVDYIEDGVFRLIYMLHNYATRQNLGVHVDIDRDNAEMTSIHTLWAQAWTYQRELREMYGINFPGSPRLEENFCLEGWDAMPPMRRDFDTVKYSAERFGHREGRVTLEPRDHMKVQLYPNRGGDES